MWAVTFCGVKNIIRLANRFHADTGLRECRDKIRLRELVEGDIRVRN
jgi:hypothetical protein